MNKIIKYSGISIVAILIMGNIVMSITKYLGIYYNTSHSVDGLFFKDVVGLPEKNDYVLACPPQSQVTQTAKARHYITYGPCPGNYEYLIKKLVAVPGDKITIIKNGMYVNDIKLNNSEQQITDGNGAPMNLVEIKDHVLLNDQYLLFGDNSAKSFDSRYFGLVSKINLLKKIERL